MGQPSEVGEDRVELRPGEARAEKRRDVLLAEAQVFGGDQRGVAVEHGVEDVEAARQFAAGDGQVQARRRGADEKVEEGYGLGLGEPLRLVEGQQARFAERFDGPQHERRARVPEGELGAAERGVGIDAGGLEGEGEVGVERLGRVVRLEGEPGRGQPLGGGLAAALGEQRGLAEAARGEEHREPVRGWRRPRDERRAVEELKRALRDRHAGGAAASAACAPAPRRAPRRGARAGVSLRVGEAAVRLSGSGWSGSAAGGWPAMCSSEAAGLRAVRREAETESAFGRARRLSNGRLRGPMLTGTAG